MDDSTQQDPTTYTPVASVVNDQQSVSSLTQDARIQQLNVQAQSKPSQSYHPVSSAHKEQLSIRPLETIRASEPGESQPEISAELKEIGVEASKDEEQLKLSAEQELAGVEPAKESVPMNSHISANLQFSQQPFTASDAVDIIKNTSPDESKHWLAVLVLSILHKLHLKELRQKEASKLVLVEKAA